MKFSALNNRIMILVSIPLIAGISFVVVLLILVNNLSERSAALELSRLRITQAGRLSTAVYNLSKSTIVQAFPLSDYMASPFAESREHVRAEKDELVKLLTRDTGGSSQTRTRELDRKVNELVAQMEKLSMREFPQSAKSVMMEMGLIASKTDPVVELTNEIIEAERRSEASKRDSVNELRQSLTYTLLAGLFGTIAITLALARALTDGIVRRIKIMKDNTVRLATRNSLAPFDPSPDEIGELDRAFHQLANELAHLESRERATIQLASDMIVGFERDFSIHFTNPSFSERLLASEQTADSHTKPTIIHRFTDFLTADERPRFEKLADTHATEGGAFRVDLSMMSISGESLLTSCSATWSETDKLFYCVLHDITERKLLEDYRAKLLMMVGHDLRAPLSTLIMSLERVQSGETSLQQDEARRLLTAAHYLRNLAESLLTAEEAQRGKLHLVLKPCSTMVLVDEAMMILRVQAENKRIELAKEGEEFIAVADKQKCTQVLVNLLENAIKYSHKSSRVRITTSRCGENERTTDSEGALENTFVKIEVISAGEVLKEADTDRLFQPFTRGEQEKARASGYGLGLPTAAQIVRAHAGEIGVTSDADSGGVVFWFTLPLCEFEEDEES